MSEPRIAAPRVAVVLEKPGPELVEYVTQTDNRDAVRWDMTRGRKNWPTGGDAPILWLTFIAWSALSRVGDFEGDFAAFNDIAVSIRAVDVNGDDITGSDPESLAVGPTGSGPVPD